MVYQPAEWRDGPEGGTPLTADSLNRLEQGTAQASEDAGYARSEVEGRLSETSLSYTIATEAVGPAEDAAAAYLAGQVLDGLPPGGVPGQLLERTGPGEAGWVDPPSGGAATWDSLEGRPPVVAAGATAAAARSAIGAGTSSLGLGLTAGTAKPGDWSPDLPDVSDVVRSATVTTVWTGTQVQYDALPAKDSATLYVITEG